MDNPARFHSTVSSPHHSEHGDTVKFQELLQLAWRNAVVLIGIPLIFGILGAYAALSEAPRYRATSLVQLDPKPTKVVGAGEEVYNPGYGSFQYYHTQLAIIKSRRLAEQLVDRLGLDKSDEFTTNEPSTLSQLRRAIYNLPVLPDPPPRKEATPEQLRELAISRAMAAINAEVKSGTTLLAIQFVSQQPQLAAEAANALADLYIEELLQSRLDVYRKATVWLTEKLGDVAGSLDVAESRLQQFRETEDIVNVGGNRGLLEEEFADLSKRLRDARRRRIELSNANRELELARTDPSALRNAQSLLLDPVVKQAADSYLAAQTEIRQLESRYGARHPQMETARAKLESAESSYLSQLRLKAQGISSELEIARRNENELNAAVQQIRNRLKELDRKEFDLNMLERNVASNKQLYDLFLSRFNQTETSSSFTETNARIADSAVPPKRAFEPNVRKQALKATLLGAVLAFLLVILRESLRLKVETTEDIESLTQTPILGVLPVVAKRLLRRSSTRFVVEEAKAPFADGLRSIRAALALAMREYQHKRIAITSPEPGEGKTTICAGLAVTFGQHEKIIIVEADLRRPQLASQFSGKNQQRRHGLSDYLTGDQDLAACIQGDELSGVDYILAGKVPPNPALLLDSPRFSKLLDELAENYDRILIDTPPLLATSDALHLTANVDAFMLVLRAEKTPKRAVIAALKRLETVNAPVAGVVLNATPVRHGQYETYYRYA